MPLYGLGAEGDRPNTAKLSRLAKRFSRHLRARFHRGRLGDASALM